MACIWFFKSYFYKYFLFAFIDTIFSPNCTLILPLHKLILNLCTFRFVSPTHPQPTNSWPRVFLVFSLLWSQFCIFSEALKYLDTILLLASWLRLSIKYVLHLPLHNPFKYLTLTTRLLNLCIQSTNINCLSSPCQVLWQSLRTFTERKKNPWFPLTGYKFCISMVCKFPLYLTVWVLFLSLITLDILIYTSQLHLILNYHMNWGPVLYPLFYSIDFTGPVLKLHCCDCGSFIMYLLLEEFSIITHRNYVF